MKVSVFIQKWYKAMAIVVSVNSPNKNANYIR